MLSSLASDPRQIKKLFKTRRVNKAGIYEMVFFVNCVEESVFVDDYFPVNKGTTMPAFSRTNESELWVMLLEKAWAKLHKTYARC